MEQTVHCLPNSKIHQLWVLIVIEPSGFIWLNDVIGDHFVVTDYYFCINVIDPDGKVRQRVCTSTLFTSAIFVTLERWLQKLQAITRGQNTNLGRKFTSIGRRR